MSVPLFYLADQNNHVWQITISDLGILSATSSPQPGLAYILLSDISSSQTWALSIVFVAGFPEYKISGIPGSAPQNYLPLVSPGGFQFILQVSNGVLKTSPAGTFCTFDAGNTIAALSTPVANRLEETPGATVFWDLTTEIYTAIVEAMNDLTILVGRPNLTTIPFSLVPNTVWQILPKGTLLVTDIQGPNSKLWRVSLNEMDYVQNSWASEWENDTAAVPSRWFPVGFTLFGVHPAPTVPIQVQLTIIPYPTTDAWPYTGTETVQFHSEFFDALEMYAAHYLRIKETGPEFQESIALYKAYLGLAERLTQIESKKDPLIFSRGVGGLVGVNPIRKR
jgi:hypothetical protein